MKKQNALEILSIQSKKELEQKQQQKVTGKKRASRGDSDTSSSSGDSSSDLNDGCAEDALDEEVLQHKNRAQTKKANTIKAAQANTAKKTARPTRQPTK